MTFLIRTFERMQANFRTRRYSARNSRRSSPIPQTFVTPKEQPICYLIRDFEKCWWRLAGRQFARPDESRGCLLRPCVLIQRNRFSLTHAMDTLIPSSRPPIPINFTDRRNIHGTRWETQQLASAHGKGRWESGNDFVPSLQSFYPSSSLSISPFGSRSYPDCTREFIKLKTVTNGKFRENGRNRTRNLREFGKKEGSRLYYNTNGRNTCTWPSTCWRYAGTLARARGTCRAI